MTLTKIQAYSMRTLFEKEPRLEKLGETYINDQHIIQIQESKLFEGYYEVTMIGGHSYYIKKEEFDTQLGDKCLK
jgi:hypothetical protein